MDSDGWLDPGAASGGLHGELPLGAPVDGIRRLRMHGARREPRQMPADGLGCSLHWGPAANFDIYLPNWLARHNKAIFGHPVCSERVDCALALAGSTVKESLKAGVLYFVLVFAAGFVLGTIRTLWVVPRLGVRAAELMEAPIMFGVSILAARWVVRHVGIPPLWSKRLALGCIALGLMLLVEFTVVLWIRGLTLRGYFETRDPVSGAVYFVTLGAFAVIPVFVGRPRA